MISVVHSGNKNAGVELENGNNRWRVVNGMNTGNFIFYDATNNKLPFLIEPDTPTGTFHIDSTGNVGVGRNNSTYKLHVEGVVRAESGFSDGSSRELKDNIVDLNLEEAVTALEELDPVKYNYKTDLEEDRLGFIAEDVPELVASNDRKGVSSMDIVAVLTRIVKEQQKMIAENSATIAELKKELRTR